MTQTRGKVVNQREVLEQFKKLNGLQQASVLSNAVRVGLLPIQNRAVELVRKKTGNAARSIHIEITEARDGYAEGECGTDIAYGARLEFGFNETDSMGREYHQPAFPYMRPAYDEKQKEAQDEIADTLKDILAKFVQ